MSDKLSPSVLAAYLRSVSQTHLRVSELHRLNEVIDTLESVDRLTAEVAAVRKDAARYLWLRDKANYSYKSAPIVVGGIPAGDSVLIEAELDAAIDAAMEASK